MNNDKRSKSKATRRLAELIKQHPAEVADFLSRQEEEEAVRLLHLLVQQHKAADALGAMEPEEAARIYQELEHSDKVQILSRMEPDDAVDLLNELPQENVRNLLSRLSKSDSAELRQLLAYEEDTAAGMMSPECVYLHLGITAQEAIDILRQKGEEAETIYYAYVVDEDNRLIGVLALRDLVLARPEQKISSLVRQNVVSLPADMDAEEVMKKFDKYNYLALPVVDQDNRLLGIVTVDDAFDQMREEATEDFLMMGGIPSGEEHPLERPFTSVRKRWPWMAANIFFNLVAVIGIAVFESSIAEFAFLAVLMPIVSDMGGNVAMQSMSVAIRGMATGQVVWEQLLKVLRKEMLVGFMNGLFLGLQLSVITYIWRGNIHLGIIAMVSLWLNTILATIIGALFPFLMKKIKLDPAMMSGSIVTTITDLCGFFLFLGLATIFLEHL